MDGMNSQYRPQRPRRRRKTQMQIFKETYLPLLIAGLALVMILVFLIGAIVRSANDNSAKKQAQQITQQQKEEEQARLEAEEQVVLTQANAAASKYDYTEAIRILDSFTGDWNDFPDIRTKRNEYVQARDSLVPWDDPSKIPNLSLQMLIANPQRAYNDSVYSTQFQQNFLTVEEFSKILEQLYANGYVLVSLSDIFNIQPTMEGVYKYEAKTIYLPEGRKPIILTQTNVNYHTYLTDGDGDKLPDKNGRGFANKLMLDADGNFVNEYVDPQGQVHIGEYDMIPLLESFIAEHPDFSYKDARAVIAVTGYDGLFGYRTNPAAERTFGTAVYQQEIEKAREIAQKLADTGYELACYTYENQAYGQMSSTQVEGDLKKWNDEVVPILSSVNIFVFAKNSDIAAETNTYNDERFALLSENGFQIFLSFSENGRTWCTISDDYIRQGRIMLTSGNIRQNSSWFKDFFDPGYVLDANN